MMMIQLVLQFLVVPSATAAWVNPNISTWELPWFHPTIEWVASERTGFTGVHPELDNNAEFQAWIAENTGRKHKFFDGSDGYVQAPWRLPGGHPELADYFTIADPPVDDYLEVFFAHPDLMEAYLGGESMPYGHPSAHELMLDLLPPNHPDIDDLFENGTRYLPDWHVDLTDLLKVSSMEPVQVFDGHPNPTKMYYMGEPIPNIHPSVTQMLGPYLPLGHPEDLDEMLRNPLDWRMPDFHPSLNRMLFKNSSLFNPLLPVVDYITLYFYHPDIQSIYEQKKRMPNGHPSAQRLIADVLPSGHPHIDELFLTHQALPARHPDMSHILRIESMQKVLVHRTHPNPQKMYEIQERLPRSHPAVTDLLLPYLPPNHPENLDEMLRDPGFYPLPDFHPSLASFLLLDGMNQQEAVSQEVVPNVDGDNTYQPSDLGDSFKGGDGTFETQTTSETGSTYYYTDDLDSMFVTSLEEEYDLPKFSVFFEHPDLMTEYDMGDPVDNHPSIHDMFEPYLPAYHPNIDEMMKEGFVLPSYHPDIRFVVEQRSLVTSPASLLSYMVAGGVLLILLIRNAWKLKPRTEEIPPPPKIRHDESFANDQTLVSYVESENEDDDQIIISDNSNDNDSVEVEYKFEGMLPSLDKRRHHALSLNQNHHDSNLGPQEEVRGNILAYKEKKTSMFRSNWNKIFGRRIKRSHHSTGEAINCLIYVIINIVALCVSPYSYPMGFGSLSSGNALFLVTTATRNSVFTWLIGITFDQALIYHRFIGRLTVLTALIHSVWYYDHIINKTSERITVTGLISMCCGILIFATSLNFVRRKMFNVFYWSHSAFLGFIVGLYLHAAAARPFIWSSVACYAVDKLLALVWTQLPRRTTLFEKVGERTAHVQFKKTPLMNLLGRYKVGQYVFVNFPELSFHEWHPFSVASAPNDACVDLYIRALGNHTRKIVDYSEKCATENKQALIRCDGPYGDLSFNYRRYGNLLLVGGGIGITPIVSLLKDIYGDRGTSNRNEPRQCVRNITLVWIMPRASEASLFLEMLNQFRIRSLEDHLLPVLNLIIHVTQDEGCSDPQILHGRPDFQDVVNQFVDDMSEFSRSMLVYACGPGSMVNQLWDITMRKPLKKDGRRIRIDFNHESFEF